VAYDLADYVGGRYVQINLTLRGLADTRKSKSDRVIAYRAMIDGVASLENELRAKPRIAAGTVLYRRCGPLADITPLSGGVYRTGDTFQDRAFLSTSKSEAYKTPQGEQQLVAVITCSETSRGHDIGDVRGIKAEAEVLFERGTRFLIKSMRNIAGNNVLWNLVELTGT
jgi:hypothetical protein